MNTKKITSMAAYKETEVCALLVVLIATGCLDTLFQPAIFTETLGEGKDYSGKFLSSAIKCTNPKENHVTFTHS